VAAVPVAAPPKAASQAKRAPTATPAPKPAPEDESEPWQQLAADTDEMAAHADTPPRRSRKADTASTRRPGAVKPLSILEDRKKVLIVVGAVAAVVLGLMVAGAIWAFTHDKTPPPAPTAQAEKPPPARQPLRVGPDMKFKRVIDAINQAVHGDRIIVQGPVHEEELTFDSLSLNRKNLTIESEGSQVLWRAPKGKESAYLVTLRGADGLKLRGFIFDGEGRVRTGVVLAGHCPSTALDDLSIQGCTGSCLLIQNCEGDKDRPVTVGKVKLLTAADKPANAAIEFAAFDGKYRFIRFNDVQLDGPFKAPVLIGPKQVTEDVTGLPR
jgi:hypothetical protein